MKTGRRRAEELAWSLGLYRVGLSLYRVTRGLRKAGHQEAMRRFYSALVPEDVLVFDIGANVGTFLSVFAALGAKVVAVEPNSDCVRHIQLAYGGAKVETLQAAVGPHTGLCTLNVSDEIDSISSVSNDWIAAIQRENRKYAGMWSRKVTVPMVTVNALIEHYGSPYFIKIDVEGFEESVLDGLLTQPPLLSFEFNGAFPDTTVRCLDKKVFAADSLFNFAIGDPVCFELTAWAGREEIKQTLQKLPKKHMHGDIFVTRSDFRPKLKPLT